MEIILAIILYFIPTVLAFAREHKSQWGIFALNLILGVTLIGWIIALIWSLSNTGRIDKI